jgi:D-glycero-alpha-D-manno-heptose-7-phosphate kinase
MIISRTPFRVSLFGGGSDYPVWYRQHGGAVVGFAINKYCYISLRPLPPFFAHRHRIVYSIIETVKEIEEIQHPAVRAVMQDLGIDFGVEIHHDGDLPARSGLGSSSSFTVGLLNAFHALDGRMVTRERLAREAIRMEQDVIGEKVGSQDQVWAAYGGMNRITFLPDDTFEVSSIIMNNERRRALTGNLMLVFTGISRFASQVAEKKIVNLIHKERQIRRMVEMVDESVAILTDRSQELSLIGDMLHESWCLKRDLASSVSSPHIDALYEAARSAGARGGKLLGAGGGGFLLLYVEENRRAAVRQALKGLTEAAIDVEMGGSKIVVYEPEGLQCV